MGLSSQRNFIKGASQNTTQPSMIRSTNFRRSMMIPRIATAPLLALFLSLPLAHAQIVTGSIGGRVSDPTGAVVGEAAVSLVQAATGFARNTTTDIAGNFLLGGLDGGAYVLKI